MSELKHTPGPWALVRDTRPHMEWNITIVRQDNPNLAVCFMTSNGPNEANARLIAAAPEMYEALCAALPLLEFEVETRGDSDSDYEFPARSALDAARAALAKATGERL